MSRLQKEMSERSVQTRRLVLDGLCEVTGNGAYSNLTLDHLLNGARVQRQEAAFMTRLFYGVLERAVTLDYTIETYTKKPVSKLDLQVLNILRMGLYQLKYMDAVPDSAAVNESVKLTAYARKASAKGLVNALLRRFIREGKVFPLPDEQGDRMGALSVKSACPRWILSLWERQYGRKTAEDIAFSMLAPPPLTLRVNTLIADPDTLACALEEKGFTVRRHETLTDCLLLQSAAQSISALAEYEAGAFYVQDASSQWCVQQLGPHPGERVLDLCAAPGGKSAGAAICMGNRGEIVSLDLHQHRVKLIEENARRLKLDIIKPRVGDARVFDKSLGLFDRVLCDVPCSGLGVMRRKPEIRLRPQSDVSALPALQYEILCSAARYLKKGGVLVYSTCTINREENTAVCARFLREHKGFVPLPDTPMPGAVNEKIGTTLLPVKDGGDGFFAARLLYCGDAVKEGNENEENGKN